ncbi:hypothetical protein SALBM217S_05756 [Streptomyces griseoloalbus]
MVDDTARLEALLAAALVRDGVDATAETVETSASVTQLRARTQKDL